MAEAFGRELSPRTLATMVEALADMGPDLIAEGCARAVRECQAMPTAAELRRLAGRHPEQMAERAWAETLRWLEEWGTDGRKPRQNGSKSPREARGAGEVAWEAYQDPKTGEPRSRPVYAQIWEPSHGVRADGSRCAYDAPDALYRYVRPAGAAPRWIFGPPLPSRTWDALSGLGDGSSRRGLRRVADTRENLREAAYAKRDFCRAWMAGRDK